MSSAKQPLFAFFGTPMFSVHVLNALERQGLLPALIITAPDKPRGRGLELSPSPVKTWALERGIEVMQPQTLKDEVFIEELRNSDWDIFLVAAYNKLIPKALLDMPQKGCLNVHPSLLPKLRGPSPARSAILKDMRETGISVMLMSEKMDAGPVLAQARITLDESDWPPQGTMFEEMLASEGGELLAETIPTWLKGEIMPEPQDESMATYCHKFSDEDALINLSGDPHANLLKIRAFDQNPRAYFFAQRGGKRLRVSIAGAHVEDGSLVINRVIPEGKREMDYEEFLRSGAKPI